MEQRAWIGEAHVERRAPVRVAATTSIVPGVPSIAIVRRYGRRDRSTPGVARAARNRARASQS